MAQLTAEEIAGLQRDFFSEVQLLDEAGIADVQAFFATDTDIVLSGKGTDAATGEPIHVLINKSTKI